MKRQGSSEKLIYDSFTIVFQNCFCNNCFVPLTKMGYSLCFKQLGLCYHFDGKPLKLASLRCDCCQLSVSFTTSFQQTPLKENATGLPLSGTQLAYIEIKAQNINRPLSKAATNSSHI